MGDGTAFPGQAPRRAGLRAAPDTGRILSILSPCSRPSPPLPAPLRAAGVLDARKKPDSSAPIPRGLGAERLLFQGWDLGRLSSSKTCDTAREGPARRRGHLLELGMRRGGRGTIVGRGQDHRVAVMTDTKPRDCQTASQGGHKTVR